MAQAPDSAEQAGLLAYHWEQAAELARAVDWLLRAGDHARLLYADQEAIAYYRRALAGLETLGDAERAARTWMKLGLTYHNAFDFHQAREAYAAGCARWQQLPSEAPPSPERTLRVHWEEPRTLDPIRAPDAHTSDLIAQLFSGLVELNAEMAVTPDGAEDWEISEDGCALTFHLRADARWSDGAPATAEDFVCAWRPEHFVSNGPFTLERWTPGECLILRRHRGYHGSFGGNLGRVALRCLPEPETRLDWYAADRLDVLGITHFPAALQARARQQHGDEYLAAPRLSTCYLVFDTRRLPFADVRVRQALALATGRAALSDSVLQGYVAPATGGLSPQGMPGHVPGIALPYAPERARRLLAEAGYPGGRAFPPVRALAFRAVDARVAYLQAQWREQLGIEIAWDIREWPDFLAGLREDNPALFIAMWTADYPDPDDFLRVSRRDHWAGWQHAEYDMLVEQARRDLDQTARLARYAPAEQILAAKVPVLPLTYERDHLLLKPWVRRYPIASSRAMFWKDAALA